MISEVKVSYSKYYSELTSKDSYSNVSSIMNTNPVELGLPTAIIELPDQKFFMMYRCPKDGVSSYVTSKGFIQQCKFNL